MCDKIETIEMEFDTETGETKIKAPWGESEGNLNVLVTAISNGLTQLIYYRDVKHNKSEHLANDIKGYEMILKSSDPEYNATKFMEIKHEGLRTGTRFKDNLTVIDKIKESGDWVE